MEVDLDGFHPSQIVKSGWLQKLVQQTWEMGEARLILIHGHGRNAVLAHASSTQIPGISGSASAVRCVTTRVSGNGLSAARSTVDRWVAHP